MKMEAFSDKLKDHSSDRILEELGESAVEYSKEFENEKKRWEELCPGVDDILEEYKRKVNGEVGAWKHDSSSRALIWKNWFPISSYPVTNSKSLISLMLDKESESLRIYGATYSDSDTAEELKRYLVILQERSIPIPVSLEVVSETVMLYGHIMRMFTGENGYMLMKDLENLSIPREVTLSLGSEELMP